MEVDVIEDQEISEFFRQADHFDLDVSIRESAHTHFLSKRCPLVIVLAIGDLDSLVDHGHRMISVFSKDFLGVGDAVGPAILIRPVPVGERQHFQIEHRLALRYTQDAGCFSVRETCADQFAVADGRDAVLMVIDKNVL